MRWVAPTFLALAAVFTAAHTTALAGCTLLWDARIDGDTLSLVINRFPERHLNLSRRVASNQPVREWRIFPHLIQVLRGLDPGFSGRPAPVRDRQTGSVDVVSSTKIWDGRTCETVWSDPVLTRDLREVAGNDYFAAFQFIRPGERTFKGRVVLTKWTGDVLWASPWLSEEHDRLHLLPDGSIYFPLGKDMVYKTPQDTVVRMLSNVPYGDLRFAADGSRMLLLGQDFKHDEVAVYDVQSPGTLKEVFRRRWNGCLATDAAVSASGSQFAVMLQRSSMGPEPHCSLVILDRNGAGILRQDLTEVNPPIPFVGEARPAAAHHALLHLLEPTGRREPRLEGPARGDWPLGATPLWTCWVRLAPVHHGLP